MQSILKKIGLSLAVVPLLAIGTTVATATVANAGSADKTADCTVTIKGGQECAHGDGVSEAGLFETGGLFQTVTNVLLFLIGAVSVIMLIIGGMRYVLSNGDSNQVTAAKNTILYAVIGIIVALLAYAIVGFVIDSFMANKDDAAASRAR